MLYRQHRFIEDSIKIAKGTASEFDINRMASYGIDEKTAKLIADMPYEKLDGLLFVANANMHGLLKQVDNKRLENTDKLYLQM